MARTVYATGTFTATSQALTGAIDLGGAVPCCVVLPQTWAAANITFLGSVDGVIYGDIFNGDAGAESAYTLTTTGTTYRVIWIDPNKFQGLTYLKIRSGTAGAPVNQAAGTVIQVGLRDFS